MTFPFLTFPRYKHWGELTGVQKIHWHSWRIVILSRDCSHRQSLQVTSGAGIRSPGGGFSAVMVRHWSPSTEPISLSSASSIPIGKKKQSKNVITINTANGKHVYLGIWLTKSSPSVISKSVVEHFWDCGMEYAWSWQGLPGALKFKLTSPRCPESYQVR